MFSSISDHLRVPGPVACSGLFGFLGGDDARCRPTPYESKWHLHDLVLTSCSDGELSKRFLCAAGNSQRCAN